MAPQTLQITVQATKYSPPTFLNPQPLLLSTAIVVVLSDAGWAHPSPHLKHGIQGMPAPIENFYGGIERFN